MASGSQTSGEPADAPYQSLYRRFRPQRFSELAGQPHVALALQNAVRDGRVGHAYLFSGPRGTGKTSTARILAKALNCEAPEAGEPCGQCESCRAITAGSSFDVHELDAASSNSVDAMRDLVARAALATPGNWKVYIVDEVHMLSTAASNALLKTLEEPPAHVVFVLATTDAQKLLPTIRSRTQHFEFHLLGEAELSSLLEGVASKARLALPEGAIKGAVRRARGSARDALSVLDQVAAAGVLDDEDDRLGEVVRALSRSESDVLIALDSALASGRDPQQLAVELITRLRQGFLALLRRDRSEVAPEELEADELALLREMGLARLVRTMELLGTAVVAMREAPEPRITFELALIRASHPEAEISLEALLERIDRLESRVAQLSTSEPAEAPPPPPPRSAAESAPDRAEHTVANTLAGRPALGAYRRESAPPASTQPTQPSPAPAPTNGDRAPISDEAKAVPPSSEQGSEERADTAAQPPTSDFPSRDDLVKAWGDHILIGLRPKVRAIYNVGRFVGTEASTALFALPNEVHVLHAEPLRTEVVTALSNHFGTPIGLRILVEDAAAEPNERASIDLVQDEPPGRNGATQRSREDSTPSSAADDSVGDLDEVAAVPDQDEQRDESRQAGTVLEGTGLAWAEDSLLRAFPGAEEVQN